MIDNINKTDNLFNLLDTFILKYHGLPIDYDGHFGNQCMDLYRQYVKEVLQFPQSFPVFGAKDVWETYLPEYYTRIPNVPNNLPEPGDIVIWSSAYGPYGHIAVFYFGNLSKFISFDQNVPTNSTCHLQQHNYKSVLGWLHPKDEMIAKLSFVSSATSFSVSFK